MASYQSSSDLVVYRVEALYGVNVRKPEGLVELKTDEIYKVKPMFWTKAVSRFFKIGLIASVIALLAYLAAYLGVEIDMDFIMYMQILEMI